MTPAATPEALVAVMDRLAKRAAAAETALATATDEATRLRAENEKLKQEITETRTELDALIQEVLRNG